MVIKLNTALGQTLSLSPRMLQSAEILQMGADELNDYLQKLATENPLAELAEPQRMAQVSLASALTSFYSGTDRQNRSYYKSDLQQDPCELIPSVDPTEDSLVRSLFFQLGCISLPEKTRKLAAAIILSLDEDGYFRDDINELAELSGSAEHELMQALAAVQSMDPPGIAARSLSECLILQLGRLSGCSESSRRAAVSIAAGELENAAKKNYTAISRSLGLTYDEAKLACELIRTLEPRPGGVCPSQQPVQYVTPDIVVELADGEPVVRFDDDVQPKLCVSDYYKRLLCETQDDEVRQYLTHKLEQVTWTLKCLEQRRRTVRRCAEYIVKKQRAFFGTERAPLLPMSLSDVARSVGLHESTVSRAMRNKFIQCSRGVCPIGGLFMRGLSCGSAPEFSRDMVEAAIKELLSKEISGKAVSDRRLCELLGQKGLVVSRRTVAKYRLSLGLPCSTLRRKSAQ